MKIANYRQNNQNLQKRYQCALLVKEASFNTQAIFQHYVKPLLARGFLQEDFLVIGLEYNQQDKAPVKWIKEKLEDVRKVIQQHNIEHVLCCDASYFKVLARVKKAEPYYGYVLPSIWPGVQAALSLNYLQLFYNPSLKDRLNLSLEGLAKKIKGEEGLFQKDLLEHVKFPETTSEIATALAQLTIHPKVTCDVETHGLSLSTSILLSISFAWNTQEAIVFSMKKDREVREAMLLEFFKAYKGTVIYHNASFDIRALIFNIIQQTGDAHTTKARKTVDLVHLMHKDVEDTKILAYLATNTTAGNELGLKKQAQEFAGNYAVDEIANPLSIPMDELLRYNAVDALATFYVYNKHKATVEREQKDIYEQLFLPALRVNSLMQLTGLPFDLQEVENFNNLLKTDIKATTDIIVSYPEIELLENTLKIEAAITANSKLKKLRKTADDFDELKFNPNSHVQLAKLLYEVLKLPVFHYTDKGKPATSGKALESILNFIKQNPEQYPSRLQGLLQAFIDLALATKIKNTFIPAFQANSSTLMGDRRLHGFFNLGGTISGRLSSSNPNLMQLPSTGTPYAEPLKRCVRPYKEENKRPEWIMVGADFSSLEDRISALQTKDPNKLKIYTDGLDAHCMRAYAYFHDQMPDIQLAAPEEKCYSAKVGGTEIRFRASDTIEHNGKTFTGREFYEAFTNKKL
jgi:DNA polymerase-1